MQLRKAGEGESSNFCSSEKAGWLGAGGGHPPPRLQTFQKLLCFLRVYPLKRFRYWRRHCYSFIRFTKETHCHFTLFSCGFTPQRIRLAFAFLSVGEDVSFMIVIFSLLFVWLSSCVLEKTCLFISSRLKRAGGAAPTFATRGTPSKRGSKAISQGISFCMLEKILILLVTGIVRQQSVKAEQRRSREAQKQKSRGKQ